MSKATRPALTKRDWEKIGRASVRWADDAEGAEFRAAIDGIVRERIIKAWDQGYDRGWDEGVRDATRDDGGAGYWAAIRRNPYRGSQ
jgi:hypothetical protein